VSVVADEAAGRASPPGLRRREARLLEAIGLVAIVVVAAALRLPGLEARGTFDGDQGVDALVVRTMVRDGALPLLGPSTSIGDFHHGAAYYYLLAPAGIPSGGDDPIALAALIAVLGVAAVGVTWWLARSIAGPAAGFVGGLLLAVSAGAVDGSTFIWNPNPIPLFAAISLAAAWRASMTGRARWWLLAGASQGMVQQLHVLGVVGLVPLAVLWLHAWRQPASDRRHLAAGAAGGLALIGMLYLPLLLHELQTGFAETAAAIAWLTGDGGAGAVGSDLATRLAVVPLRIVAWPLVGPFAEALAVAVLAVAAWCATVLVATLRAQGRERLGLAWLGGSVVLGTLILAAGVRSLATVTPLPNDHYHAFLWPAITAAAGVAVAVVVRSVGGALAGARGATTVAAAAVVSVAVAWNLSAQPPGIAADGGWPAAETAGRRVAGVAGGLPTAVMGIPEFKKTGALTYPLAIQGVPSAAPADAERVAVLCDALFEPVIGKACGGAAEEARVAAIGVAPDELMDRFEAAPGRWISVYRVSRP
jgi:hypothetical protein